MSMTEVSLKEEESSNTSTTEYIKKTITSTAQIRERNRECRSIEEDLIKAYKNLPELWDTEHLHYTNKYKRNAALDILLKIMRRLNPLATRLTVRQKINMLRSIFRKDLRKYLASKYIGPQGVEIYEYKPRNWKFYALRFLEKYNSKNDIAEVNIDAHNFEDVANASNASTSENDEPASHTSDVLASITENESLRCSHLQTHTFSNNNSNKRMKLEIEDEYYVENHDLLDRELEAIGANVTCKLKRMNPEQRYHAELLINKVLITGLKNNLSDDTDLTEVYQT